MNAIILVAGMGTRIAKLSKDFHKALLPVDGIPNIERTIKYLKNYGIDDITLVTGHNAYLFDYLKDKYSCRLIFNEEYKSYNNIYSFYKAKDYFGDTIVIDGDVVLLDNIFIEKNYSFYYTTLRPKNKNTEWIPVLNSDNRVIRMDITDEYKPSLLGISYWTKEDAYLIKTEMETYVTSEYLQDSKLYWDNIPCYLFDKIFVSTYVVKSNLVSEIDTPQDYKEICNKVK